MFIAYPPNEPKENYGKLLAIPSEDMTGKYARYLLASADGSGYLWRVNGSGSVNNDSSFEFGVRPVGAGVSVRPANLNMRKMKCKIPIHHQRRINKERRSKKNNR